MRKIFASFVLTAFLLVNWESATLSADKRLSNWLTMGQIEERVIHDLPPATPLSLVERYFSENNVAARYSGPENQVFALINNIWGGDFLVSKSAQIIVHFDAEKKVTTVEVKPVFTGP